MAGLWAGCSRNQASSPVDLGSSFSKGDLTAPESGRIRTQIALRGHLDATASAEGCENNPGPFITLNGELSLGGINGRLIFRNNERGTHEHIEDKTVDIVLLNEGRTIRFAKQPPEGGVGGNPWIWIQFFDGSWNPISSPTVLGRCVHGLRATSLDFGLLTDAEALVTTGDCDNSGGPNITLTGELDGNWHGAIRPSVALTSRSSR